MLGVILTVLMVVTSLWVYLDATTNKIGRISGARGMFNLSAGGWAAATFLLWVVAFPAYLLKRRALVEAARAAPVEAKRRGAGLTALALLGGLSIFLTVAGSSQGGLPRCDSKDVARVLESIPLVKAAVEVGGRLSGYGEAAYDGPSQKRTCRVTVRKDDDQLPVTFTVTWQDESKAQLRVAVVE
jgi:hypothetical protein